MDLLSKSNSFFVVLLLLDRVLSSQECTTEFFRDLRQKLLKLQWLMLCPLMPHLLVYLALNPITMSPFQTSMISTGIVIVLYCLQSGCLAELHWSASSLLYWFFKHIILLLLLLILLLLLLLLLLESSHMHLLLCFQWLSAHFQNILCLVYSLFQLPFWLYSRLICASPSWHITNDGFCT